MGAAGVFIFSAGREHVPYKVGGVFLEQRKAG